MTNPDPMGTDRVLVPEDHEILRMEPWLKLLLAACLPVGAAALLPRPWLLPMLALSGALLLAAIVMVVKQDSRKRR
jgi:hypothetical protein